MMKKNGFTLAEVLITLAIIGVVATLTLPALMTNTGEQQAIAGFKKGINTLTEAAQMNSALEGFDYSGLLGTTKETELEGNAVQSLYGLITTRTAVDIQKSGKDKGWYQNGSKNTDNYVIYFRDGAALSFNPEAASSSITATHGATAKDGLKAVYDINGNKAPNVLSNCAGKPAGNNKDAAQGASQALATICTKQNRVIKDQFGVVLTGGNVLPNGPAARWAVSQ